MTAKMAAMYVARIQTSHFGKDGPVRKSATLQLT